MQVGGLEADLEVEFDHKQGYLRGVRLASGGLAVIDVVRVHLFDANGKRVKIVGQKGSGPEEFRYLTSICRTRGDTLIVNDSNNRRITIIDAKGEIVRTVPQGTNGSMPFNSCFDDGTFLTENYVDPPNVPDPRIRFTRRRTDGTIAAELGQLRRAPFDMVSQSEPSVAPFGNRFVFGNTMQSEVGVYDASGKLISIVRSSDAAVPVTDADVERRISSTIPRNVSADERKQRLDRMRASPHAPNWPAYARVLADPTGQLWVQDYRASRPAPDGWTAFDASGKMLGRLVFPVPANKDERQPEVISFGRNDILIRTRDADGASYLGIYPIVRTTPK